MDVSVANNQNSSCRCGSPLQLDVLSLNRKLLGDHSKKLYCLTCMSDLFECAVVDVVSKLDAFKREGCRLFPVKDFYYRMVLKVEYGTCCKKDEKWEKNKVYDYSSDKIFYDDATLEWQGGQTLGKFLTAGGITSALYLNPINTAEKFGGSNIKKLPWSPQNGTMELDGFSYGDISMEIDWVVSNTLAPGFSSVPNPWGTTIQWHDIGQKRTGTKLPDNDIVKKGHQTIKIKWECGDAKGWNDEGTDPKIEGGSDRNKNQEHMQKGI